MALRLFVVTLIATVAMAQQPAAPCSDPPRDVPATLFVSVSIPEKLAGRLVLDHVELHAPRRVPICGVLTPAGAVIDNIPPGTWRVLASGRLKDGFVVRAAETEVEILAGATQSVSIALTDALYSGRVTRGGEPVRGVINLKPADVRSRRRHAVANLDKDGVFHVLLEGAGDYALRVQETGGGAMNLRETVRFGDSEEEVKIELPSGRIRGRIVDKAGAAAGGAVASATEQGRGARGAVYARGDATGNFVLEGVDAGTWEIKASTPDGRSAPVTVSVDESVVDGVTLVVEPVRSVKVRVVDSTGNPMRDTFVATDFPVAGSPVWRPEIRMTGAEGVAEFRLSAMEQSIPINLVVATADIRISCALRRLDARLENELSPTISDLLST